MKLFCRQYFSLKTLGKTLVFFKKNSYICITNYVMGYNGDWEKVKLHFFAFALIA